MLKDSPARYYQKINERIQKSFVKEIIILLRKKTTENENMVANDI